MSYQNLEEITRNYRFFIIGYGPAYKPNGVEIYGKEPEEIVNKLSRICSECGMTYSEKITLWNAIIFNALALDGFCECYTSDYNEMMPALLATHRLCKLFELNDDITINNIRKIIAVFYSKKEDQDMWSNQFKQKLLDDGTTRYHKD